MVSRPPVPQLVYRCTYRTLVFLHCHPWLTVLEEDWSITSRWVRADQRWCWGCNLNWWGQHGPESSFYLQALKDSKPTWQIKAFSTPYFFTSHVMFTTYGPNNSGSLRGKAKSWEMMIQCQNVPVRKGQFSRIKMMYHVLL